MEPRFSARRRTGWKVPYRAAAWQRWNGRRIPGDPPRHDANRRGEVIVPQLAAQDEFLFRFQREAEAAGRLRHPNVVNVTDFGSAVAGAGQSAYLVMEFLDGENLSDFLRKNPRPAADEILDIVPIRSRSLSMPPMPAASSIAT